MKKILFVIIWLVCNLTIFSQTILTKEQALQTLLENNYSVKLSKNDLRMAENNASIYNSRYLPTVSLGAGANYSNTNQDIEAHSGAITSYKNSESQNYNASVGVNYTIFNGFNRKYLYQQMQEQLALTKLDAQAVIEESIINLYSIYYQAAELSENVQVLNEALQISKQRLQRTIYKYEYGQTNKLAMLNAEVDVNNDSIKYINTKQALDNAKLNMLLLMGEKQIKEYTLDTQVVFIPIQKMDSLITQIPQNIAMQKIEKALEISEYGSKISRSGYMPSLGFNTSYGWNHSKNPVTSMTAGMMSYGFNAGLSLSWNIFDGGASKTKVQNAQIYQENQLLYKEQLQHQLHNTITSTYRDYQNKRLVLQTQEQSLKTAKNNFYRTEELFKIGRVTSVEYRQAQLNLLNTQTAILTAKYDTKMVELQLLQLTGSLQNSY